ncbi:signal transduction histidine kinase, LytS [Desulfitobacterium hafniense DCB-2]|uniref:Signal transduction histidine kinase, LytS n=1 Tax=Desulfitobacterium hafniense (strain DSM 10664 / DCB-2) TaxID=272564 RepID=B8FUP0_DESHD|nr:histidine kinase [Desulfitobacterium hafniense]ACL22310.1 signal transduction histidine kinase, LytS [Desulfitobacterium hafniense DCB-2]
MKISDHGKLFIFFLFIPIVVFPVLFGALNQEFLKRSAPVAEKGTLDLSAWNFAEDGIIELGGEWEFYWGQLLSPDDFKDATPPALTGFVNVLFNWVGKLDETKLTGMGSGTYRLLVKNMPSEKVLAIKKSNIRMSSVIFVNGKKIIQDGRPALLENEYLFSNIPRLGFFEQRSPEILVQVSNYDYIYGGIVAPLILGETQDILELSNRSSMVELIIVGSIFTIGWICFLSYFFLFRYKKNKIFMSMAVVCFSHALTNSMYGERTLLFLFPHIPFDDAYKLLQLARMITGMSLVLFLNQLDKTFIPKRMYQMLLGMYALFAAVLLVPPLKVYAYLCVPIGITELVIYIGIFIRAVYTYSKAKEDEQERTKFGFLLCALGVLSLYVVNLAFFSFGLVEDMFLGFICSLIFALMLMVYLAVQLTELYVKNKEISLKLALQEKETIEKEYAFLRSQIKPHFLYNALNTIISYCYSDSHKAGELLRSFSNYLRGSFDFEHSNGLISIEREMMMVYGYVDIQKARFGGKVEIIFDIAPELLQCQIPALSVQPLVENAIRHGIIQKEAKGTVRIKISRESGRIMIQVTDDGIGIPEQQRMEILNNEKEGTGKKTLGGVGLYNVQKRLKHTFGSVLKIESTEGTGTKVYFEIDESKALGNSR